jgi:hypothetical protein
MNRGAPAKRKLGTSIAAAPRLWNCHILFAPPYPIGSMHSCKEPDSKLVKKEADEKEQLLYL